MDTALSIRLNGAPHSLPSGCTVADLVSSLGLAPEAVAVEINRELVPRRRWVERHLAAGDEVELVTLVGGG
jgi:thiamine biosynthesis protein ThiS